MKRVNKKLSGLAAGVATLGAVILLPAAADAAVIVDLRFADGTKSKPVAAGTYQVDVWAQVTGANASPDEGLLYVYGSVQSQQVNGGTLLSGTSGVSGNAGNGPVFTTGAPNGQAGTGQNLTADGVADWGTVATNNTNTIKYNTTLNNGLDPAFLATAGVTANALANGVEFKVGTLQLTLNVADVNAAAGLGAETRFTWVKGTGTFPAPHTHRIDGSGTSLSSAATYLASTSANAVTFTPVPEPAAVGLLGLGAIGLVGRRRSR